MERDRQGQERKRRGRNKQDRGKEKKRRRRRFERNQRVAGKECINSRTTGKGLNVLEKNDDWIPSKELRQLKDAPDDMQYRDS